MRSVHHVIQGRRDRCQDAPFRTAKPSATFIRGAITVAVIAALATFAASPAHAQTQAVLYNFTGTPDGANPYGGLTLHGGNLFGTTYSGGLYGLGSVFELTPNGNGGWTETVIYNFCPVAPSCTDGSNPTFGNVVFDKAGNLYGTTYQGGSTGDGVVFKLSAASGNWTQTVIYNFLGQPDAAKPVNGLITDAAGNLFGTAYSGGVVGNGAVFELSPTGLGTWTERVIANVSSLFGGLVMNASGYLFGTASASVYALVPDGSGGWKQYTVFTFNPTYAAQQGSNPNGTLAIDSKGLLYGTTVSGGKNNLGVVYRLLPSTTAKFTEKILYNFGANGTQPHAGVVIDSLGNLYGTTTAGGKNNAGVVYELLPNTTGGYSEKVIQPFIGINGAVPYAPVILDSQNYLYGTTFYGGANGMGTVYTANPHATLTTTTVTSNINPSTLGEKVTFTATVTSPLGPPPDGEVVVFEPVGQANMVGGVATYTTGSLNAGTTKITAVYGGDLNYVKSSGSMSQTVNP